MLPDAILSRLRRYQAETSAFTTWLAQSAKSCGYLLPKTSQKQCKYPVPLKHLPKMADTILATKDPAAQAPDDILTFGSRAVLNRRVVARELLEFVLGEYDEASDRRHAHFANKLDATVQILKKG